MGTAFTGKVALVTGASKGIGKAIADLLADRGAEVIRVARGEGDVRGDVGNIDDRARIVDHVQDRGQLDILVNNAGTNVRKPTLDWRPEDFEEIIETNLASAWWLSQKLFPLLKATGGNIVNISSTAANVAVTTSTAGYAMTKAAMDQMTRFLAVEWGPSNVRVNSVQPWYIKTPLAEVVLQDEQKRQKIEAVTPMPRLGEPIDIAKAVAFLASDEAAWITGVCLPVDGGMLAKGC